MEIEEYIKRRQNLQSSLLKYLEYGDENEEDYQIFINLLEEQRIRESPNDLKELLNLIVSIANNHHKEYNLIEKLQKIILYLKDDIRSNFLRTDIFHIFKSNKLILLFLFEKNVLPLSKYIMHVLTQKKYVENNYTQFFAPELKKFIEKAELFDEFDEKWKDKPEEFEENRKKGENEDLICQIIRDDSIDIFISHVSQNQMPLRSNIKRSIFEMNKSLTVPKKPLNVPKPQYFTRVVPDEKVVTLIEYTAFFGSIQIFKYLYLNENSLLESSIWPYAMHSNNPELINFIVENKIVPYNDCYMKSFLEALKCHHNDVANYIYENYLKKWQLDDIKIFRKSLKYYNFVFMKNKFNDLYAFYFLCKYNYVSLVELLLKEKKVDVNYVIISKLILFLMTFLFAFIANIIPKNINLKLCFIFVFFLNDVFLTFFFYNVSYKIDF